MGKMSCKHREQLETVAVNQEGCAGSEWWQGGLFRPLSNRTDDGLGMESERKREIKDAARLFVCIEQLGKCGCYLLRSEH